MGTPALSASLAVLVVCPDRRRCGELIGALQARGIPAVQASEPSQATFWLSVASPSLVVLDLATEHSTTLLDRFRRAQRSVVALSDDANARRSALEAGCLDADRAGANSEELALKIKALFRVRQVTKPGRCLAGPLIADRSAGRLTWWGEELRVSAHLFDLAAYLIEHCGEIVPTDVLLRDVWGAAWRTADRVHKSVWRLRHLLGLRGDSPFLVARRGYGYGIFPEEAAKERIIDISTPSARPTVAPV